MYSDELLRQNEAEHLSSNLILMWSTAAQYAAFLKNLLDFPHTKMNLY